MKHFITVEVSLPADAEGGDLQDIGYQMVENVRELAQRVYGAKLSLDSFSETSPWNLAS